MTVYRPKGRKTYRYDFVYLGERHLGNTSQVRQDDAELVESKIKLKLRQQAAGIAPFDPSETPRFQAWAPIVVAYQKKYTTRPDLVQRAIDVVLEFWGDEPATPRKAPAVPRRRRGAAPYHDLRLGDPIANPKWIVRFLDWIDARGVSGSTRNTYLSTLSTFYRVALEPQYRVDANVPSNPFRDIRRSPRQGRLVALEPDVVLQWIGAAAYHVALAATIAALAPKMRLQTILGLQWAAHFDKALTRCTVQHHKTAGRTAAPQVTPLSGQLQEILRFERERATNGHVVTFHGEPVVSITRGARGAAERVGLTWGIQHVTFHTIRHSIATLLADLGLSEALRKELLGHTEIRTTQQYTHLAARSQVDPHEQLSAVLPLKALVLAKAPKSRGGASGGSASPAAPKRAQKRMATAAIRPRRKLA